MHNGTISGCEGPDDFQRVEINDQNLHLNTLVIFHDVGDGLGAKHDATHAIENDGADKKDRVMFCDHKVMTEGKVFDRHLAFFDHFTFGVDAIEIEAGLGSLETHARYAGPEVNVFTCPGVHPAMCAEGLTFGQITFVVVFTQCGEVLRVDLPWAASFVQGE